MIFFANEECKFLEERRRKEGLREVLIDMKGEKMKTIEMFFTDFTSFSLLVIFLFRIFLFRKIRDQVNYGFIKIFLLFI